jgi:outer membrane scaffolding protein for murein synthesis (MipA/OmpV family)
MTPCHSPRLPIDTRRLASRVLPALCMSLAAAHAQAAGGLILIDAPPAQGYTLAVGPALVGFPEAPGSSHLKLTPIPGVDFYSSLGGFASTDIGLGWNFSHREDLQYGVRLWPVFGRDDDRSRNRGLTDVGTRLGKGLFLNYAPWKFLTLQSSLMVGSGAHGDGLQAEAGATVGTTLGASSVLGLTAGTTWSNGPYQRSYFGVTPEESAAGGLPVYRPSSGFSDINLALNGETRFTEHWKLSGQWLAARLIGDDKRSPVTQSRLQNAFSLTLWYTFK